MFPTLWTKRWCAAWRGVTDRQYLFEISDAIAAGDSVKALEEIARLRQQSVDMRRLCMELAAHYRNLMLCALPGGNELLTGTSPEEEAAYQARKDFPQRQAVRAINAFGAALEKMARGTDQRIELELAVFSLDAAGSRARHSRAGRRPGGPAVCRRSHAVCGHGGRTGPGSRSRPYRTQAHRRRSRASRRFLNRSFRRCPNSPLPPPAPAPQKAARPKPSAPAGPPQPFPQWSAVLEVIAESDAMLYSFLQGTRAYYDGRRVLFECSDAFRDYIKKNKDVSKQIKETIYQVTHLNCFIGPYEAPRQEQPDSPAVLGGRDAQTDAGPGRGSPD